MKNMQQHIEYCRQQAREHDPDRYYISLFAPAASRAALWALIAFYQEVSKTRTVVSEPMLGEIRLQWWREALEGIAEEAPRAHPVVEAMAASIPDFPLVRPYLDQIIDTWSDNFGNDRVTLSSIEAHAMGTGGALNAAVLMLLDCSADEKQISIARQAGKIWTMIGTVRALPYELANPSTDWHSLVGNEEAGSNADLVAKVMPTATKLVNAISAELDALQAETKRSRQHTALKTAYSLVPLAGLDLAAVKRAGQDLMAIDRHLPGNARKLLALMKYQFWG